MEHELKAAADYARCSQIWQRVAPGLDPYPSDSPAPLPAAPSPPACPALQLELLRRFIAGELESRCAFLRCARCAPSAAARRAMQLFAREEGAHARRLQSVHYLLTGSCFPPPAVQATAPLPWREALRTGGMLFFEVGIGQADDVLRIMRSSGFGDIQIVKDLNNIPRVVYGTRVETI